MSIIGIHSFSLYFDILTSGRLADPGGCLISRVANIQT